MHVQSRYMRESDEVICSIDHSSIIYTDMKDDLDSLYNELKESTSPDDRLRIIEDIDALEIALSFHNF